MTADQTAHNIKNGILGVSSLTFGLAASTVEAINHCLQTVSLFLGVVIACITLWNQIRNRPRKK